MGLVSQRNALKTGTYVRRLVITLFIANWQPHNQAWRYSTLERSTERPGRYQLVLGNIGNRTF
jgi:hypothetical protein